MLRRQIQAVIGLTASNTELLNWVAPTLVKGWGYAIDLSIYRETAHPRVLLKRYCDEKIKG
jgi:hypothetical protein